MDTKVFSIAYLFSILIISKCESFTDVSYKCSAEDLGPCDCIEAHGKVFVECSSLKTRQQLSTAVRKMAGYGITELLIKDSNISYIPHDLFKESPVSRIRIKNSAMFYLFNRELENSAKTLTEITVDNVHFEGGLDWSVLENLMELQSLIVSGSEIENIPYSMSELELPLETLILQNNYIEDIYELAFQNLKNMKNLKLRSNFLKTFLRSMLPQSECGIQFLDLSHNRLTSLPGDMFSGMTELHSLLLAGNHFAVLEKTYMEKVFSSLTFLDVTDNPLQCGCEMTWLLSNDKPFHFFGQCTLNDGQNMTRNLKDLTEQDFGSCFL